MKTISFLVSLMVLSPLAWAYEPGGLFLDPHVAVGFNSAQKTHFRAGVDVGFGVTEQLALGVGGYYSAGQRPSHDREMGVGPFAAYLQPLTSWLVGHLRQEVNYVDLRDPQSVEDADGSVHWTHEVETGIASVTSLGLHFIFTPNFGFSAGYRLVVGLSNSDLDNDRSGLFAGFSIGF